MNLFYSPGINPGTVHLTLSDEESAHAVRVLRMKSGEKMIFTDGKGMFYESEIVNAHPKKCFVKIIRSMTDPNKRNFHLTIAIAPTKSMDRFEWFLEKATELGCDAIIPIQCRHSERTSVKTERLNKVIVSAMKQCLKSQLPALHELTSFTEFLSHDFPAGTVKAIGHIPELNGTEFPPENPKGKLLQHVIRKGANTVMAIGPEGGFSEEEVALAEKTGFIPVSLGRSRLRVETAGITSCAIVNSVNS